MATFVKQGEGLLELWISRECKSLQLVIMPEIMYQKFALQKTSYDEQIAPGSN